MVKPRRYSRRDETLTGNAVMDYDWTLSSDSNTSEYEIERFCSLGMIAYTLSSNSFPSTWSSAFVAAASAYGHPVPFTSTYLGTALQTDTYEFASRCLLLCFLLLFSISLFGLLRNLSDHQCLQEEQLSLLWCPPKPLVLLEPLSLSPSLHLPLCHRCRSNKYLVQ